MLRENAKQFLPIITAFAEGKIIEIKTDGEWEAIIGEIKFNANPELYRIKPEPKMRPWKLEEIPIGAIARRKTCKDLGERIAQVIIAADITNITENIPCAIMHFETKNQVITENLLTHWEWKYAHETRWNPCGIVIES